MCSLIGALGLYGKYWIERLSQHQFYPSMESGKRHKGQELYGRQQKKISEAYKKHKAEGGDKNWNSFVRNWHSTSEKAPTAGTSGVTTTTSTQAPLLETPEQSVGWEMDVLEDMDFGQGQSAQGAHAQAVSGASVGANKKLTIPRSLRLNKFTYTFTKSRIFYTYGYAFQKLVEQKTRTDTTKQVIDMGDVVHWTTPLAVLPNDMIGGSI